MNMSYLPPFNHFKRKMRISAANGTQRVQMDYEDFLGFVKLLLRSVPVDEPWYLKTNPDVADAVEKGKYKSAKHHFVEDGYLEGRTPFEFQVDESWYAKTYPDVAAGLKEGALNSGKQHFWSHGYIEGRLPSEEY
jgi:hypothetical protein